jgi:flavin reductase (DIM6/NTAB) family NADH-FMN oxidoreductase RutF
MIAQRAFRSCLGSIPTGVTVVTAQTPDHELVGVTVNSFSSVSRDPPLVLFSLNRTLRSLPAFDRCSHFAVNVLREDQDSIESHFARPSEDKWAGIAFVEHDTGAPIFENAIAWFACDRYAKYDGGDHEIIVGRVVATGHDEDALPLVFHRGRFHRFSQFGS